MTTSLKKCENLFEKNCSTKTYFHHEEDGVKDDKDHDEVLKGRGDDDPPDLVLEAVHLAWHVTLQRFGRYRKIDARFLRNIMT